jgi:hypothetical protein
VTEKVLVRFTPFAESHMADGKIQYLYAIAPHDSPYALGQISVFTADLEETVEIEVEILLLDERKSSGKVSMSKEGLLTDTEKQAALATRFSTLVDDALKLLGMEQYSSLHAFKDGDMIPGIEIKKENDDSN